jgi:ankyrin repeat protein
VYQYLIETLGCDVNAQNVDNDTPVHQALRYFDLNDGGDTTVLIYLLSQKDVNVNTKGLNGHTLLHTACRNISRLPLDIFKVLIEILGCDVNGQDDGKNTPVHCALYRFNPNNGGDINVLTYLLTQKGVNVNIKGRNGYSLLHVACVNINILPFDAFKVLIEILGCDVNGQDDYYDTPLHTAIRYLDHNDGSTALLTYLINQKGVNVNIQDQDDCTLLHLACKNINTFPIEIFKLLIETHGADVDVQEDNGDTPIHNAFAHFNANHGGDITVLNYLLSQKGLDGNIQGQFGYNLLHMACHNINKLPLGIFQCLIETHGCDVNVQDKNKNTPLHYALGHFDPNDGGDIAVLHYLLSRKGVNINIKGRSGCTLLHEACQLMSSFPLEIFKLLIETHGADVNAQNSDNDTPLHCALRNFNPHNGDIAVLYYLLNQKIVDVNIKDKNGHTLLRIVCQHINKFPLEIFKLLIETYGADINVEDNDKNIPLYHALLLFNPNDGGDITVLTYLLNQKDVNVNIKNKYGHTLLHLACMNINTLPLDIFKVLIETMGFDVNVQDDDKDTPLRHALLLFTPNAGGNITVLTYLLNQKNINANIKGEYGHTLLHTACGNINDLPLDIFKLLIETHGADVNVQDENKDTPLHLAFFNFDSDIDDGIAILTYLLTQKDVNFNIKGQNDRNLLHWASICDIASDSDGDESSDDFTDSDYDLDDSDNSAKSDTTLCQIVKVIVETCLEQIIDETRF